MRQHFYNSLLTCVATCAVKVAHWYWNQCTDYFLCTLDRCLVSALDNDFFNFTIYECYDLQMYFLFMYFAFNQISSWDRSWVQHKKIYFFAPHRIPLPLNLVCERISMRFLDVGRSNAEQCRAMQSDAEQWKAMQSRCLVRTCTT